MEFNIRNTHGLDVRYNEHAILVGQWFVYTFLAIMVQAPRGLSHELGGPSGFKWSSEIGASQQRV